MPNAYSKDNSGLDERIGTPAVYLRTTSMYGNYEAVAVIVTGWHRSSRGTAWLDLKAQDGKTYRALPHNVLKTGEARRYYATAAEEAEAFYAQETRSRDPK